MSQAALITTTLDGVVLSWNVAAERVIGFRTGEMTGRSIGAIVPGERAKEFGLLFDRARSGIAIEDAPAGVRTRDGHLLDVLVSLAQVPGDAGRPVAVVVIVEIAAEAEARRQTQTALLESDGRWRAVIASAVDAMIVIDARGVIEVFNPAAERLFGYATAEAIGQNVSMLMPAPDRDRHDSYLHDYLRTGEKKIVGIGREIRGLRRDGSTVPLHLSVGEMSFDGHRHFTGILHDLTPRVQLEARIREQEALARLGEMAAVIAHEVKNPLAAVRGAIQVIGGRLPAGSQDAAVVSQIVARIDALGELLKDLLLFARTPQPRLVPVDLGSLLRQTGELLSRDPALREHRFQVEGQAEPIPGDPELLKIVMQNLLLNAAQAMQGRGTTTVVVTAERSVQQVTVTDGGPGLSAEAHINLFRPFFTTKSRGTGLGLATAKRLVELHGGSITLESAVGSGTTATVTLPAATGDQGGGLDC